MRSYGFFLTLFIFAASAASAQQWSDVNAVNPVGYVPFALDGQPISSFNPNVIATGCNANQSACGAVGINIQNFASTSYVNSQFTTLDTQFSDLSTKIVSLNANLNGLASEVSQLSTDLGSGLDRANELAVISASMKDAVPNDGDRFALRMNMAEWNGNAAGSMSFSMNINHSLRLSVDYGQGRNQSMLSGGVNFSFN